jgi:ferredoxin
MSVRKIIKIDEEKCDGCGLCIPQCAEGALQIINGKARLIEEKFCDGLGACLGQCPQEAITIEEKEAEVFDETAVHEHLLQMEKPEGSQPHPEVQTRLDGCPSAMVLQLKGKGKQFSEHFREGLKTPSNLGQWPIQLKLVPTNAPYFQEADLLIVADCIPFAYADFHRDLLNGKAVVVGCPKLDDPAFYVEKLSRILIESSIKSITTAHMDVPCCFGLVNIVQEALRKSSKNIPVEEVTITIGGERKEAT